MYKFYIKIYLKSGKILYGTHNGIESNSAEVSSLLFCGDPNMMRDIVSLTGGHLFFNVGQVAAYEIDSTEIE